MADSRTLKNISLAEETKCILKQRILKGQYAIGERIIENQVANELRVSRTPVREAIKHLEKEGLIQSIPNRGTFAMGFTMEDIRDIYEVRGAVEVLAIERVVQRITDKELDRLQEIYDIMEFYTKKHLYKKILELNSTFHSVIYKASGSRFLSQVLNSYQEYVEQARKMTVSNSENLNQICIEHGEILGALKSRDLEMSIDRTIVHLNNSKNRAEKQLAVFKIKNIDYDV